MKPILMFYMETCPYCREARAWMREIVQEHPEYAKIPLEMVEERERPDVAEQYDYWYVPTYFVGGEKAHEGAASRAMIEAVYRRAFEG